MCPARSIVRHLGEGNRYMNPDPRRGVPRSAEEWMDHAESDIRLAHLAAADDSIRPEHVCFHAQQAAEKAIKAVLVCRQVDFPLTHDIEELLVLAETNDVLLPETVREAGVLTPYAVQTRYPGYLAGISRSKVKEALEIARNTISWARNVLSQRQKE